MKRFLLLISLTLISGLSAKAQCTPDPQFTDPGIYPDSATGLAPACIDQAYQQLITNVIPVDTSFMIGPIPFTWVFDSVVIVSWTGLPTGFTHSCYDGENVASPVDQCAFEGGTAGCAMITGSPTAADIGSYQQIIVLDVYVEGGSTPQVTDTVDYYYIHIVDCSAGVETLTTSKFLVYPNPAKSVITLNGLNGIDVQSVTLVDMQGKTMQAFTDIEAPALDMEITYLDRGMYFIHIEYDGISEVIKFIKE